MRCICTLVLLVVLFGTAASSALGSPLVFNVNVANATGPWEHYWERCVGSCHAWTGLRADWQSQMRQTRLDLGFQSVRMHGIFVDDMSVVLPADDGIGVQYSFFNVDQVYDFLQSIGMKPYVELSFMPDLLASGNTTWSHYLANITPPKTWQSWADLITAFVQHLVDRYGVEEIRTWNFEVWNEPNCCPSFFWTDGQAGYFELFNWTSRAVKAVDPAIPVGGPTTAMSQWIPEFMAYCKENNVPYDFIATHEYPTDPPGPQTRDFFKNILQSTRTTVGDLPLYYSEYDDGYDDDTSYAAAFAVYQAYAVHGLVDILSWWPFSDIFEEQGLYSMPFNAPVAGLQNIYGVPKPSYRAFQLMHWTGDTLLDVSPTYDVYPTVGAFAVSGNHTSIFVFNWNVMGQTIANETVQLNVTGLADVKDLKAIAYRVDSINSNAMPLWQQMGQPQYLVPKQVELLKKASELVPLSIPFSIVNDNTITLIFPLEAQSLINIIIRDHQHQ